MPEAFRHLPLRQQDEMRLIEFAPCIPPSSPIRLSLKHDRLEKAPRYWTLSYTWGTPFDGLALEWRDPTATKTIYIGDAEFEVRWNLEAALRYLICAEVPAVWIDAICINQSDITEKNDQVQRMMARIYKDAVATLAWLGPSSNDCSNIHRAAKRWLNSWNGRPEQLKEQHIDAEDAEAYIEYARYDLEYETVLEDISSVSNLLSRSWFSRAWVVQEVVLSKNVCLIWGDKVEGVLLWDMLYDVVSLLYQHLHSIGRVDHLQVSRLPLVKSLADCAEAAKHFHRTKDLRKVYRSGTIKPLVVFWALRFFEATDPRDHVFAAEGMIPNSGIIKVDYNETPLNIFLYTTKAWLTDTNDLSILALRSPSTTSLLPSWAIDFSIDSFGDTVFSMGIVSPINLRMYSAGGPGPPVLTVDNNGVLVIHGVPLGVVAFLASTAPRDRFLGNGDTIESFVSGDPPEGARDLPSLGNTWLREWFLSSSRLGLADGDSYIWTGQGLHEALLRTLCADILRPGHRIGENFDWSRESQERLIQGPLLQTLVGRTFATSSLGYFCLVQEAAQVGDVIFVAMGSEMPYLLRPQGNGDYAFHGYVYVHGWMDGKAIELGRSLTGVTHGIPFRIV